MADFISSFWDLYVAGFTAFGLILCIVLLVSNMTAQKPGASPQLQGHVWDETLREYNNPLPRWWLFLFVGTIVFSVVYLVIYPGFGSYKSTPESDTGLRAEYAEEVERVAAAAAERFAGYPINDPDRFAGDSNAMATGQRLFVTYCAQCHGVSAKGSTGYPDLTDNDWLFGGDLATIKTSIADGRSGPGMTPFGNELNSEQIKNVAGYVLSLSGQKGSGDLAQGKEIFAAKCTVCHGTDGKGSVAMGIAMGAPGLGALGAPDLTDNIWLYGDSEEVIIEGIKRGRNQGEKTLQNHMPAWKGVISRDKIDILAAYVYSLSKGK